MNETRTKDPQFFDEVVCSVCGADFDNLKEETCEGCKEAKKASTALLRKEDWYRYEDEWHER
ncbi:hypothetical protein G7062_00025 [Erysipelothrix sp. HDW6C]|uniref:hypothetical protein n=1 Tax=Erysipelothrix sp. HDW6C TaxID=2714930 RepID=UPI001408BAD0|nr:hypothetical protein [Erysipelothrix sp. HDW6C]QIK68762.1 hypothetical protein G7062_00025 [Erysipelothrix sp. HDW6C]